MRQAAASARRLSRALRAAVLGAVCAVALGSAVVQARVQPVRGEATLTESGGYARLLIRLQEDVEADVSQAGAILIIRFKQPVDLSTDRIADALPDYVGMARRDPNGGAIRLALNRKVSVNAMAAGERLYVDLLPEGWTGAPPSLPPEVLRELSERARAAERALRQQQAAKAPKPLPPVRVRAAVQPTFVRFTFDLPDGVAASSEMRDRKLTLHFAAPLTLDLADAKLAAPPSVAAIAAEAERGGAAVTFALIGNADIRAYRDDKSYVVDVAAEHSAAAPSAEAELKRIVAEGRSEPKAEPAAAPVRESAGPKPAVATGEAKAEDRPVAAAASETPKQPQPLPAQPANAQPAVAPPATTPAVAPPSPAASQAGNVPSPAEAARLRTAPDGAALTLPFASTTPAALYARGDALWLVLDDAKPVDLEGVRRAGKAIVTDIVAMPTDRGQILRFRLARPRLAALAGESGRWTLNLADAATSPPQPLSLSRSIADPTRAAIVVPMTGAGSVHRIADPDAGDTLVVVTAAAPARAMMKRQNFVEVSLLESMHGLVVQPGSDDVSVAASADQVTLTRPGGLTLSGTNGTERSAARDKPPLDLTQWQADQQADFLKRRDELSDAVSKAEGEPRQAARAALARFYLARGLYAEAKGLYDLILSDLKPGQEDAGVQSMRALCAILIGRPAQGLKELSGAIGGSHEAQLWRALALAKQGKWAEAREKFKSIGFAVGALPLDLQRIVTMAAMRASLEVKDFAGAATHGGELDHIGVMPEMKPPLTVMRARLDEALGRDDEALAQYREAIASGDREAAADAKMRELTLRMKRGELSAADALPDLETLSLSWRGDALEVRVQHLLAKLYASLSRYGDALAAARVASELQPASEVARQAQDDAMTLFAQIFLGPKGDDLPPIEALSIFYEHRDLTPIGRRGDEMIRRLSERLVAVDLLDQASELLQYQVDRRLEGAARAQVAARLAMVYLMNRKPERAIAALRLTRLNDLAGELRQQRLLLEARALSDTGRHELALDVIINIPGREVVRLRSDIFWASRRWREAAEQIELYLGDRWRDFNPLSAAEKSDVIRAAIGYALAEDALGVARFREKFAPLMKDGADREAFEVASAPATGNNAAFAAIAKMAARVDTLDGFLREMRARFPDAQARLQSPAIRSEPETTGSLPPNAGSRRAAAAR